MGPRDDQGDSGVGIDEEEVDRSLAMTGEPIIGMDKVVYDEETGPGALDVRPMPAPRGMSAKQRAVHDITHLPYDPNCEICTSCRRPNTHHRSVSSSERAVPLMVGDYAFPKHSDESDTLTLLVIRVYPYKLFFCCAVPSKGRHPEVVRRLERFIRECGLTHFTYRSDREPAIQAMMEEAVSLAGRNGKKNGQPSEESAIEHSQLVSGGGLAEMPPLIDDDSDAEVAVVDSEPTHTAAPELTHPGESQSNGLAERSVGIVVDQFRTLKMALEAKLRHRLPSNHPVTAWLVEHTAWVLNKYHLGADGRTAYGRLHGREGRERVCEFGETIMWLVPKKLRSKLDQRWRYGTFLGRALGSDQNFVGIGSGEVVCARAIVRVVPSVRWSTDRVSKITTTPLTFKIGTLDHIEESRDPQAHPEVVEEVADEAQQMRRVRIFDGDVKKYGYTDSCPRCQAIKLNQHHRAKMMRHNEECREHVYDSLRADGAKKVLDADSADVARTRTHARRLADEKHVEDRPIAEDAPETPIMDTENVQMEETPIQDEPKSVPFDDTTQDFFLEVDNDPDLGVAWDGPELIDHDGDHSMNVIVDLLQSVGVTAADAVQYAVNTVKCKPVTTCDGMSDYCSPVLSSYSPSFFEIYGHGNLIRAAHGCRRNLNVNGLRAMDLRTCKPDGERWDFSNPADRKLAKFMVETEKPTWLIGSPPCTFFSSWNQGINHRRMPAEKVEQLRKEAILHLHFVVSLYKIQLLAGRHFLHEHPAGATSWNDDWIKKLISHPKVSAVVSDQCEYGLLTPDANGTPTPAKKPTRWMSSSPHMIKRLSKRCGGDHAHQHLVSGRAKAAEDYSLELISEILRGIRDTADHEEDWDDSLGKDVENATKVAGCFHDVKDINLGAVYKAEDAMAKTENLSVKFKHDKGRSEVRKLEFKERYKDEYTGEDLPMGYVREAMREELDYFCDRVWVGVPLSEAQSDPEAKIVGSRWVNCNKNDAHDPDVRCRLVAQEVNLHADDSFYAATPPLEAKRLLFSQFASRCKHEDLQLSFVDVRKAYFYGVPERKIYVRLPPELGLGKGTVGKLVRCMYGTRDAGAIWESCYAKCLVDLGFTQGVASPCCFHHPVWKVSVVVHGDDFTALGSPKSIDMFEDGMRKSFECKMKGRLGTGPNDLKEMRVLNRIVRITEEGVLYEGDPRHAEMIIKAFNLTDAKAVVTPGVKMGVDDDVNPDDVDSDAAAVIHRIIAELNPPRRSNTKVVFKSEIDVIEIPAYSTIYGMHPRDFVFNKYGKMIKLDNCHQKLDAFISMSSPNLRRSILEHTLRNGAAWETPTTEFLTRIARNPKKKFAKTRIGSKAAKQAERLDAGGNVLDTEAATMYRALSARILYLSLDRPELAFAAKELCRHFAHPTKAGVEALKRAARFLIGLPRLVWHFPFQADTDHMRVFVDTDFGGCVHTRRSTSGGIAMLGTHSLKHWSTTQSTIALSSGEAELSGICKGASTALGLQALALDLGIKLRIEILTDATAAIGICRRRGLGKIRHLHVSDLWIQDRLKTGDFKLSKVAGADNPADILTKHVTRDIMRRHMEAMNLRPEGGRASSAPTIDHG